MIPLKYASLCVDSLQRKLDPGEFLFFYAECLSRAWSQVVSLGKHSGNDMKSFTGANISAEEAVKHVEKTVKETALVNAGRLWKAWGTEVWTSVPGFGCCVYIFLKCDLHLSGKCCVLFNLIVFALNS